MHCHEDRCAFNIEGKCTQRHMAEPNPSWVDGCCTCPSSIIWRDGVPCFVTGPSEVHIQDFVRAQKRVEQTFTRA